jgi:hypothetical protein
MDSKFSKTFILAMKEQVSMHHRSDSFGRVTVTSFTPVAAQKEF